MFLDEPTTGLDSRRCVDPWEQIRDLRSEGITVVLTTQYFEEADRLADHIAVINHGQLVAEGTPTKLKANFGGQRIEITVADPAMIERAEQALSGLHPGTDENQHRISVTSDTGGTDLQRAAGAPVNASVFAVDVALHQPALDDVFLALTGRPALDDDPSQDGAVDVGTASRLRSRLVPRAKSHAIQPKVLLCYEQRSLQLEPRHRAVRVRERD